MAVLVNVLGVMVADGQFGNYRNAVIAVAPENALIVMALERYNKSYEGIMKKTFLVVVILIFVISSIPIVICDNPERPSELTITVSNYTPSVGDTVVVTLIEIAYEPGVDYMWFGADVYYGDKKDAYVSYWDEPDYILENWNKEGMYLGNDKFKGSFSFVPDRDGLITIDVYAHRQYDMSFDYVEIYASPVAKSSSYQSGGLYGFGAILLLVFCIILLIIVIYIIYSLYLKKKLKNKQISDFTVPKVEVEKQNRILNFCPECGTKLVDNYKFCPACGMKL